MIFRISCVLMLLALTLSAGAQGTSQVDIRSDGNQVIVNEVVVLTVLSPKGETARKNRAAAIARHLDGLGKIGLVKVSTNSPVRLMLGNRSVVTLTAEDSKAQNSEIRALAQLWAKSINSAAQLPPLLVGSQQVEMPPDKPVDVVLTGSAARKAELIITPPGIAKLTRSTGKLLFSPIKTGTATLSIKSGKQIVQVPVAVLPYAAQLPQTLRAEVIGLAPSSEIATAAVRGTIQSQLACADSSSIAIGTIPNFSIPPGSQQIVKVPIIVRATGRYPTDGVVAVQVTNLGGSRQLEDLLWYSNEPENLREAGDLYWGKLNLGTRVRLLWHHVNKTNSPMVVSYRISNPSHMPARISIVCGDAEPDLDPTKAGYFAGDRFFSDWLKSNGQVLQIPPLSSIPIVLRGIRKEETTSGLATLSLLSGGPESVIVTGESQWLLDVPNEWRADSKQMWPWSRVRPISIEDVSALSGSGRHIYAPPYKSVDFSYRTGGPFQFIRVGEYGISDAEQNGFQLSGNFGVHYSIQGTMQNPSAKSEKVEVVFEASAGYAGALFVVNGKYVRGKVISTKNTLLLHETTLAPGAIEALKIETLPLSGAHYPITITVKPKIAD